MAKESLALPHVHLRRGEKSHGRNFGSDLHVLETVLRTSLWPERQQILVVQIGADFVQVGLERDGLVKAEIEGRATGFVPQLAQAGLCVVHAERESASAAGAWRIHRVEGDVFSLRSFNRRVEVGTEGSKIPPEVIDAGRNKYDRASLSRLRHAPDQ